MLSKKLLAQIAGQLAMFSGDSSLTNEGTDNHTGNRTLPQDQQNVLIEKARLRRRVRELRRKWGITKEEALRSIENENRRKK